MDFERYVGKEVIGKVLNGEDVSPFKGTLLRIEPGTHSDDYEPSLVIRSGEKDERVYVGSVVQFFLKDELDDRKTEYYYVVFRYGKTDRSKEHIYMSYDYSIKPGDKVLVWNGWLYIGNVIKTGFFTRYGAPYPLEKTWLVKKKVYDRVDFLKYDDSEEFIGTDNSYKNNWLNKSYYHRQYLAVAEWTYEFFHELYDEEIQFITENNAISEQEMGKSILWYIESEASIDDTNQIEAFYYSLWLCNTLAKYHSYDKYSFDMFLCLSLIYFHGDFDRFMPVPQIERQMIESDMNIVFEFLKIMREQ